MQKTEAPFTDQQVRSINDYQTADVMHPFTCGNCRGVLVASTAGLSCQCGNYTQSWVHDFMADDSWRLAKPWAT